jgi:uncharacterized small protein (DUF1192 family)
MEKLEAVELKRFIGVLRKQIEDVGIGIEDLIATLKEFAADEDGIAKDCLDILKRYEVRSRIALINDALSYVVSELTRVGA